MSAITGPNQPDPWDRLRAGDKMAWDAFVLEHAGMVLDIAKRLSEEETEAEEIALEVFALLTRNSFQLLRTFDLDKASLQSWLTALTVLAKRHSTPAHTASEIKAKR